MIFNAGGGSCGPLGYAAIGAVFSPNSDCTCSNGTLTYTANNAEGYIVFGIPSSGTWTVTCGSISKTITITHKGQCEIANVKRLYLFADGRTYTKTSGDIVPSTTVANQFSFSTYCGQYNDHRGHGYLLKQMDVTNYSSITINMASHTTPRGNHDIFRDGLICVATVPSTNTDTPVVQAADRWPWTNPSTDRETYTKDLSGFTGVYYVGFAALGESAYPTAYLSVYDAEVYLE